MINLLTITNLPELAARCDQMPVARLLVDLERHLIEARPVCKPMHLQPLFKGAHYFAHACGTDVSRHLFQAGICLPSGSNLGDAEQDRVIDHLRHALTMGQERHAFA